MSSRLAPVAKGAAHVGPIAAPLAIVAAFYIWWMSGLPTFPGFDTPWYLWRARLTAGLGLDALGSLPPQPFSVHPFRSGHPTLAAFMDTAVGVDPMSLAFTLPVVMGMVIALSAGAFALEALREGRSAFPAYAIIVGASLNVALTSVGHADTLIVDALAIATATLAVVATMGRRSLVAAVLLLVGAVLTHWSFATFFAAILLLWSLVLIPDSRKARRSGAPLRATPTGRVMVLLTISLIVGMGVLVLTHGVPSLPGGGARVALRRALIDLPRLAPLMAVAAIGFVLLLRTEHPPERRRGMWLAVVWACSPVAAFLVGRYLTAPVHRYLEFALGIPLLAAAGVTGTIAVLRRLRPSLAVAASILVAVLALTTATALAMTGFREPPRTRVTQLTESRAAGAYLAAVREDSPVIFVIDPGPKAPMSRYRLYLDTIRSALPTGVIPRTLPYLGTPENLMRGAPTLRKEPALFNRYSLRSWQLLQPLMGEDPIVIALESTTRGRIPDGPQLAPGVVLLQGPALPAAVAPRDPQPSSSPAGLTWAALRALGLVTAVGLGWSMSLIAAGPMARVALAPAFGIAVMLIAGMLLRHWGLGAPGHLPWVAVGLALLGWSGVLFAPLATLLLRRAPRG